MKPTTTILIGSPVSGDEARFLQTLYADLEGTGALILANFVTPKRQIDFVVVTPTYAALLELKNFPRPIFGEQNGIWTYESFGGNRIRYGGENPWQQTKEAKFSLSDEMSNYQKKMRDIPAPSGRGHFTQFNAFVCVYPAIHSESRVTPGDHKVAVRSYKAIADSIKADSVSSTWNLEHWRRFAEEHLKLSQATLGEATSPEINAASTRIANYMTRLKALIGTGLPPLFSSHNNTDFGEGLIDRMTERKNFLLVGPSGSTKTFHLHHLALAILEKGEEIPLLFEAKRYRGGDFWTPFKQTTAALFRGDPKQLLDDLEVCGLHPVLMVDALNECKAHLSDLLRGVQTFAVQFDARVVLTSQTDIGTFGDIRGVVSTLPLLDGLQKRSIYAYHAGVSPTPDLDYYCAGFSNAYDLTIAGRRHGSAGGPDSRTDLYDSYVRQNLPHNPAVASALLRALAAEMAKTLSMSWMRDDFDRFCERFLDTQDASLKVLDELQNSRLLRITDDVFSFEHELLFDYFNAEHLRRESKDVRTLATELRKPRNHDLLELIVPRFATPDDISAILNAAADANVLCRVLSGMCGVPAQTLLLRQCESLLDAAAKALSTYRAQCETARLQNGRIGLTNLRVTGTKELTNYESLLCSVVALNLDNPRLQPKFLELLDMTEWTLRSIVQNAANASRFKPEQVWGEAVRRFGGLFQAPNDQIPCSWILATIRSAQMYPRHYKQGLPIRGQLFERVEKAPPSHFSMLVLLEDLQQDDPPIDIDRTVSLIQQSLNSGVSILRSCVFNLVHSMGRYFDEIAPQHLPLMRRMLEAAEIDDIFDNSLRLDALTALGGLEPPVSLSQALTEIRTLIAPDAVHNSDVLKLAQLSSVSPEEMLAQTARGCLSNIFEDIFQDVYSQAYSELSDEEKHRVLRLAAMADVHGFTTDWIVRELLVYGNEDDLSIFQHLAARPDADPFYPQGSVAVFAIGIKGCAQFNGTPPSYQGDGSSEHIAWRTVGEILFWMWRRKVDNHDYSHRIETLWDQLHGSVALATADVLYQLSHCGHFERDSRDFDLISVFPYQTAPILEQSISNRESLSSLFSRARRPDHQLIRFTIDALGRIGLPSSVPLLQAIVDDHEFGKDAIQAIEVIQRNIMCRPRRLGEPS